MLAFVTLFLQFKGLFEYVDTVRNFITTIAGMAVIEAINCFEKGKSIVKGISVVVVVLLIVGVCAAKFFNISGDYWIFYGGILAQCAYAYWRTK